MGQFSMESSGLPGSALSGNQQLEGSDANLGMLDDVPIVVAVEIEGDLDLIETASEE
jgi:hypothetical protein